VRHPAALRPPAPTARERRVAPRRSGLGCAGRSPLSARARGLRPRPLAAQPLRGRMALSRGPDGAAVRQRVRGPVEGASPACGRAGEQPRQRPRRCLNSAGAALTRARSHAAMARNPDVGAATARSRGPGGSAATARACGLGTGA
jgi:hypothetical protein